MGIILTIIILLLLFIALDEDVVVRDTKNKKEINLTDNSYSYEPFFSMN